MEINRLRSEEASLRDSLLKMQALNEGLGQDKIELNRIVMQLEQDKAALAVSCDLLGHFSLMRHPGFYQQSTMYLIL